MSSIFHRLDELERVQQEILAAISGQESGDFSVEKARKYPKGDENARSATHSHEMHPKVTNKHTLVERVMVAYQDGCILGIKDGFFNNYEGARAAILEIANTLDDCDALDEHWTVADWLRSQVEP